jgi:hypothetical protein
VGAGDARVVRWGRGDAAWNRTSDEVSDSFAFSAISSASFHFLAFEACHATLSTWYRTSDAISDSLVIVLAHVAAFLSACFIRRASVIIMYDF